MSAGVPAAVDAAVRATLSRYIWFADSGQIDDLLGLFAENASYHIQGGAYDGHSYLGRAAISESLWSVVADFRSANGVGKHRHYESSIRIEPVDPRTVRSSSYFLAVSGDGPDHWGTYRDVLVERDGRWLFQERTCRVEGMAPQSWHRRLLVGMSTGPRR